jgi:hypothetical protein
MNSESQSFKKMGLLLREWVKEATVREEAVDFIV